MGKQVTTTTREVREKEQTLETSMMFEEGIEINTSRGTIKIQTIKIWSSREYAGEGPYQTIAILGTPSRPFNYNDIFYKTKTPKKEEIVSQHFNTVNHFCKQYLSQA